jgi:hypothetical protein
MKKCLIICHGYFGDHLFANSIAEHLLTEEQFDTVDYVIGFPQVAPFFQRNPFVNKVIMSGVGPSPSRPSNWKDYDACFQLQPIKRELAPAIEMQLACGVKNPSSKFHIYTNKDIDSFIAEEFSSVREKTSLPILAIMNGWMEKTFLFTEEQYAQGIDVPNLGYGGSHRNTDYITEELTNIFPHVMVGAPKNVNQFDVNYSQTLDLTASILKQCDYFIGAEGGLANLAYAVGTPTIITSDFVHQLYGPNGVLQKLDKPQLGPCYYESFTSHIDLDPYLTDEEVVTTITNILEKSI